MSTKSSKPRRPPRLLCDATDTEPAAAVGVVLRVDTTRIEAQGVTVATADNRARPVVAVRGHTVKRRPVNVARTDEIQRITVNTSRVNPRKAVSSVARARTGPNALRLKHLPEFRNRGAAAGRAGRQAPARRTNRVRHLCVLRGVFTRIVHRRRCREVVVISDFIMRTFGLCVPCAHTECQ